MFGEWITSTPYERSEGKRTNKERMQETWQAKRNSSGESHCTRKKIIDRWIEIR